MRVVLDADGPLSALVPAASSRSNTLPLPGIPRGPSSLKPTENQPSVSAPTGPRKKSVAKPLSPPPLLDRIGPLPLAARMNVFAPPTGPARDRVAPGSLNTNAQYNQVHSLDPCLLLLISFNCRANRSMSSETQLVGRASVQAALKKGPRRTAKRNAKLQQTSAAANRWVPTKKTREELDAEMDEWGLAAVIAREAAASG